jgi:hypothetical protein
MNFTTLDSPRWLSQEWNLGLQTDRCLILWTSPLLTAQYDRVRSGTWDSKLTGAWSYGLHHSWQPTDRCWSYGLHHSWQPKMTQSGVEPGTPNWQVLDLMDFTTLDSPRWPSQEWNLGLQKWQVLDLMDFTTLEPKMTQSGVEPGIPKCLDLMNSTLWHRMMTSFHLARHCLHPEQTLLPDD